jgi:hypothetical protein
VTLTPEDLEQLREKYRLLIELREARDQLHAAGRLAFDTNAGADRRARMKALAGRFPGALRELEHATAEQLRRREEALRFARETGVVEPWMEATAFFHRVLRETLRARLSHPQRPASGRILDAVWTTVGERLGITAAEAERLVYPESHLE